MKRLLYVTTFALLAATGLLATDGPLTPLMNLRVRTDENGYLRVSIGASGATDGPLTPMGNLRGRNDENGYLRVSIGSGVATFTPDGDCSAPPITFVGDTDTGFDRIAANNGALCAGGATIADWNATRINSTIPIHIANNSYIGTGTTGSDARVLLAGNSVRAQNGAGAVTSFYALDLNLGSSPGYVSAPAETRWKFANGADNAGFQLDFGTTGVAAFKSFTNTDAATITSYVMRPSSPAITAGSATGLTVNDTGSIRELVYKVTLASTAFVCNDVTCDVTIGTLPANTRLLNADAAITTTFACTATCTSSTLSMIVGKGSGGAEYLASFDADAATAWFGDADAEMGTLMTRAAAIQGGTFSASSQAVVLRLTSGTGNIGDGAATNLSQGSVTVYLRTVVMP